MQLWSVEQWRDILQFVTLIELANNPINTSTRLLHDSSVLAHPALAHRPRVIREIDFNVHGIMLKIKGPNPFGTKCKYLRRIDVRQLTPPALWFLRTINDDDFPPPPSDIVALNSIKIDLYEMGGRKHCSTGQKRFV